MAGDRLQIVLTAKDEISAQLKQTKAEMVSLGRTAATLQNRMEAGEQGLQDEYEQTRRALEKNRLHQIELGRSAAKARSEIREMTTEGTAGLKRMDRSADGLNRSMDKTHRTSKTMSAGWGKMIGIAAAVTAAVGAMSGAFRFLSDSVNEAREARKSMSQMAAVMKSMGRTEAPRAIERMISQLSELSGIDDDELRVMTNTMLTFGNVTEDTFTKANELALDMSVLFGKDLQSSAVMVGKALNDPLKGLTSLQRIGVSFTAQQTDQIKAMMAVNDVAGAQKIIIKELTREVGGSAKAQADGIAKTQVAWKNLKEAIGEVLMSTGTGFDLVTVLKDATKWIKRHKDEIVSVLQKIISVTLKVASVWAKWVSFAVKGLGYIIGGVASLLQAMAWLDPRFQGAADNAKSLADGFGRVSEELDTASQWFDRASRKADEASRSTKNLKNKLDAVGIAVDKLNRKKVNDLLRDTKIPGVNSQGGMPVAAMGGFVQGPTLVGELGPELFVPTIGSPRVIGADGPEIRDFRQSGTVIPNHLLATVTIPAQKQAVPSGPQVHIGTINAATDVDVERDVLRAMMRADRIARERQ